MDKQSHHDHLVADREVGVKDVEKSVLVCRVLPHVEEVDGVSEQVAHQEDEGDGNHDNFPYLVENM